MSALIKAEILNFEYNDYYSLKNIELETKLIVIPFISKFSEEIQNNIFYPNYYLVLRDSSVQRPEDSKYYKKVEAFGVNITIDKKDETLWFETKEKAKHFIEALKLSINDFYKNCDAYINYIN
mgnify:CR=1 FL=1